LFLPDGCRFPSEALHHFKRLAKDSQMFGSKLFIGAVAAAVTASPALASMTVCDSRVTFAIWATMHNDKAVIREDFSTVIAGVTANSLTGKIGSEAAWTASAIGGLDSYDNALHTLQAGRSISVEFASGQVFGIGGDFFFKNGSGQSVGGYVTLALSDGTQWVRTVSGSDTFAGFWSNDAAITRITISPVGPGATSNFLGMDNMDIGFTPVPTPGAIALLSLAGYTAGRRRRG
jgi:MYXO-CTERM domain-containing protein